MGHQMNKIRLSMELFGCLTPCFNINIIRCYRALNVFKKDEDEWKFWIQIWNELSEKGIQ